MKISVIIPVYNSEKFIKDSVLSVINQKEVGEILLIEDGSIDDSLKLCQSLASSIDIVKILKHPNGKNLGAGKSRNFGILRASNEFLAFLDADDYYLNNRFKNTKTTFHKYPNIDGVYEIIGVDYNTNNDNHNHISRMNLIKANYDNPRIPLENTGVEPNINPKNLFNILICGDKGWIHLNGLTIKKESLLKFDLFSDLEYGEDTDFILRVAYNKKLISTNSIEPVAVRRVHDSNRIPYNNYYQEVWNNIFKFSLKNKVDYTARLIILFKYIDNYNLLYYNCSLPMVKKVFKMIIIIILIIKHPFYVLNTFLKNLYKNNN